MQYAFLSLWNFGEFLTKMCRVSALSARPRPEDDLVGNSGSVAYHNFLSDNVRLLL